MSGKDQRRKKNIIEWKKKVGKKKLNNKREEKCEIWNFKKIMMKNWRKNW